MTNCAHTQQTWLGVTEVCPSMAIKALKMKGNQNCVKMDPTLRAIGRSVLPSYHMFYNKRIYEITAGFELQGSCLLTVFAWLSVRLKGKLSHLFWFRINWQMHPRTCTHPPPHRPKRISIALSHCVSQAQVWPIGAAAGRHAAPFGAKPG